MRSARTYRRRRLGALLVLAIATWALYTGARADAESPAVYYNVSAGDTLWSVTTAHYASSEDPRPIVEEIRTLNDLSGSKLYPGMRLKLPSTG